MSVGLMFVLHDEVGSKTANVRCSCMKKFIWAHGSNRASVTTAGGFNQLNLSRCLWRSGPTEWGLQREGRRSREKDLIVFMQIISSSRHATGGWLRHENLLNREKWRKTRAAPEVTELTLCYTSYHLMHMQSKAPFALGINLGPKWSHHKWSARTRIAAQI